MYRSGPTAILFDVLHFETCSTRDVIVLLRWCSAIVDLCMVGASRTEGGLPAEKCSHYCMASVPVHNVPSIKIRLRTLPPSLSFGALTGLGQPAHEYLQKRAPQVIQAVRLVTPKQRNPFKGINTLVLHHGSNVVLPQLVRRLSCCQITQFPRLGFPMQ